METQMTHLTPSYHKNTKTFRNPKSTLRNPLFVCYFNNFSYKYGLIYSRYEFDCKNSKIIYLKKNYNKKTLKRYVFFQFRNLECGFRNDKRLVIPNSTFQIPHFEITSSKRVSTTDL